MHKVTCVYCNEKFDRDTIPFVQISTRKYAHQECSDKFSIIKTQEEKDYEALENYIMNLFGKDYINAKTRKQIKQYKEEYEYTFSGMQKALFWWYNIEGNSISKANDGIGILPYIYQKAHEYYYRIWLAEMANSLDEIEKYKLKTKEIEINSPRNNTVPQQKLFEL